MKSLIGTILSAGILSSGVFSANGVETEPAAAVSCFPFQPGGAEVVSGEPLLKAEVQPGASNTRGPLFFFQPARSGKTQSILLKSDLPLPESVRRIGYWILSRGSGWCEVNVLVQEPDGNIYAYRAPASGDSPWTFYEWEMQSPSEAVKKFAVQPNPGKLRRFRGLLVNLQPFSGGGYRFGDVVLDSAERPAPRTWAWTLRDVAEDISYQSAFTGFRLAYAGVEAKARLPLVLFFNTPDVRRLRGMIYDSAGRVYDNFELESDDVAKLRSTDLILPALPRGNYWIDLHRFGAGGELLNRQKLSYLVQFSPVTELPPAVEPEISAIFPDQALPMAEVSPGNGKLRLKIASQPGDIVKYSWFDQYKQPCGSGIARENELDVPQGIATPALVRLELELERAGKTVDRRVVRVKLPGGKPPVAGVPAVPQQFFPLDETETISITQPLLKESFSDHLPANGSNWSISLYWDEIEPVRGEIQYPVIDRYLKLAREKKIPVNLTFFIHLDHLPEWVWYDQLLDQNGQNMHYSASFTRKFSPCSARTVDALCNMISQVVKTYKDCPEIVGWNFSQGVESFWSDASRNRLVVGYDAATVEAFRNYLKERKFPLAGTGAASYDEVQPPVPVFDGRLDLRALYLAWEEFRQQVVNSYFERIFSTIRAAGATQPIKSYAGMGVGDITRMLPVYRKYGAELCFGGRDSPVHAFLQSQARNAGVPLIGESFALPPFSPTLQFVMFTEIAYGAMTGGTNIMWGRHFSPGEVRTEALEASAVAASLAKKIRSLGRSELVTANGAVMFGMLSMVNRSRSSMWIDWTNLNTNGFSDALNAVIGNNLQMTFLTDATPLEILRRNRLIVLNDSPLLRDESAFRLAEYVKTGGTLILMGEAGRFNQDGKECWTLKKSLGEEAAPGKTFRFGQGKVVWLAKPLDWNRELMPLIGANGFTRPVRPSGGAMRAALRRNETDGSYQLFLFGKTWNGGNPHAREIAGKTVTARVEIRLPAGSWLLTDVFDGKPLGSYTAQELSGGIELSADAGKLKMIELKRRK